MVGEASARMWATLIGSEAQASVALDGETQVISGGVLPRQRPGYGCPHCGAEMRLDTQFVFAQLTRTHTLPCCGYAPGKLELVRWLRACRLLAANAAAH